MYDIGATIRIGQENQCLPYTGFLINDCLNHHIYLAIMSNGITFYSRSYQDSLTVELCCKSLMVTISLPISKSVGQGLVAITLGWEMTADSGYLAVALTVTVTML